MDTILRLLEGLRRDEIVWLNTYLTGRLRAMPPPAAAAATAQVSAGPAHADIAGDSVDELPAVALAERVGDFNIQEDPSCKLHWSWEANIAMVQLTPVAKST